MCLQNSASLKMCASDPICRMEQNYGKLFFKTSSINVEILFSFRISNKNMEIEGIMCYLSMSWSENQIV